MTNYATIQDLEKVWKTLTDTEKAKAEEFIKEASSRIRLKAKKEGKDFDELIANDEDLAEITKGLVCNIVKNAMNVPTDADALSSMSIGAGGYSWSGTYANPGGGVKLTSNDWKALGLGSQKWGGLDVYGVS